MSAALLVVRACWMSAIKTFPLKTTHLSVFQALHANSTKGNIMDELTPQPNGMHWAVSYIGRPWQAGAKGPDCFDYWSLLIWVQKHYLNRNLPDIPVFDGDLKKIARTFLAHPERKRWRRVKRPKQGDALLMRQSRHPIHVGLWVIINPTEQGILHCIKGRDVVFQNTASLKLSGWQIEGFYHFARKAPKPAY